MNSPPDAVYAEVRDTDPDILDSAALDAGRVATSQTVGGSGALRIGADFLKQHVDCHRTGAGRIE